VGSRLYVDRVNGAGIGCFTDATVQLVARVLNDDVREPVILQPEDLGAGVFAVAASDAEVVIDDGLHGVLLGVLVGVSAALLVCTGFLPAHSRDEA